MPSPSIQSQTQTFNGGGATAVLSFGSNVTAGNLLVAFPDTTTAPSGVADSQTGPTNTWAQAVINGEVSVWWTIAGQTGPCTVTVTCPTNSNIELCISEEPACSGVRATGTGTQILTGTPSAPAVTLTGTTANDLVIFAAAMTFTKPASGAGTVGANPLFPLSGTVASSIPYQDGLSPGGSPVASITPTDFTWVAVAVAFIPAGGGGAAPTAGVCFDAMDY